MNIVRFQKPIPSSETVGGKTDHVSTAIFTPDLTQAPERQEYIIFLSQSGSEKPQSSTKSQWDPHFSLLNGLPKSLGF